MSRTNRVHTHTPIEPRGVSIDDAAAYLGVNPRTIRRMISSGQLTGYRVGSKLIRLDIDEVDALMRPIPTTGQVDA